MLMLATGAADVACTVWCAPDMGVNWKGGSPFARDTVVRLAFMSGRMAQILERGNCGMARSRGKEA